MIENPVPNREKKYKIAVIVLSAALVALTGLCLWEHLQPDEPSLIGEFQWFSLLSNYDQSYEQITKTYGDIISEDDLLTYQQGAPTVL